MEESKESTISIIQFFNQQTQDIQITQEFIDRFLYQYDRKDTFYSSFKAYDEWFHKYYSRYDVFIKGMKKELNEQDDYQLAPSTGGDQKIDKRTEYLIRFEALQQLEMSQDKRTRVYYRQLQQVMNKYVDQQRIQEQQQHLEKQKQIQEQLKAKDAEILKLKYPNPESVYYIRDKRTKQLLYVGVDKSKQQNRPQQHLTQRSNILMGGYQLIDLVLATMNVMDVEIETIKVEQGQGNAREKEDIEQLKPVYNVSMNGSTYICLCDPSKTYKRRKDFETHMKEVHQEELEELAIRERLEQEEEERENEENVE